MKQAINQDAIKKTRAEKRELKKRVKMRVDGASVKKLQKIIISK